MAAESASKRRRMLPSAENPAMSASSGGLIRSSSLKDLQAAGEGPMSPQDRQTLLEKYHQDESAVEAILPLVGELYRRNIVVALVGRSVANNTAAEVLRMHQFASQNFDANISINTTLAILQALKEVMTLPFRVDVGLLVSKVTDALSIEEPTARHTALVSALSAQLADVEKTVVRPNPMTKPRDVVLYGFGRIGRILARMLIAKTGAGLKMLLRAIVVRKKSADELIKRAYLLAQDSVHGRFPGTVTVDEANNAIIANGNIIHLIHANAPEDVDYTAYGIEDAIVVDNTGVWRDAEGLGKHLKSKGAAKVVLTAPAKGSDVPTVVVGVNNDRVVDSSNIYSAASCTTNAIVPSLKVLNEVFGIVSGHVETVHSYTNDQNLIDNFHKKARRGRAAALNLVLTETGAAKAVAKSVPELAGKLTGNAIRVPTPNVSMAILMLQTEKPVSVEAVNKVLFDESTWGRLHLQIGYSHDEDAVSSDFVGEGHTGVVDGPATIATDKRVNLYIWYDNEWGYSAQVIRLVQKIAGVEFPNFPVHAQAQPSAGAAAAAQ